MAGTIILTTAGEPGTQWKTVPGFSVTHGVAQDFSYAAYKPTNAEAGDSIVGTALPTGWTLDNVGEQLRYGVGGIYGTDPGATPRVTSGHILRSLPSAEADWQERIAGSGVVWYHDFRSADEVNNFRWTPGYGPGNGNDPLALGTNGSWLRWINTDSITGSGCMEKFRAAGTGEGAYWWRPMSPIVGGTTTGNGRGAGANDPGAGITPQAYAPTSGAINNWGDRGYYGHSSYHSGSIFDGTEYYLQMRVKISPAILNASANGGKMLYLTTTFASYTNQEINTEAREVRSGQNYFSMYRSGSPPLEDDTPGQGEQPGTTFGTVGNGLCYFDNTGGQLANCWKYPLGEWCTLLYQIRPGLNSGNDTIVRVWAALPGEQNYTKIWDQTVVDLPYDLGHPFGHNALILAGWYNGINYTTDTYIRWTQIIFSKQTIPCPTV